MDSTNRNTALCSAFADELARCGASLAVISPGSRSSPLALALFRRQDIEVEVALDERSAAFFALGAAQATRTPVVLICTSGTAAANFHPAVAEADLSAIPLIVLTADRPPELRGIGAGQTIDQIKLYGDSIRWFCEVGNHEADDHGLLHFRSLACRAFAVAQGDPRPGPVHLNFPLRDPLAPLTVAGEVTATRPLALEGRPEGPLTAVEETASGASRATVSRLVAMIQGSDRTLILAGRQRDASLREPLSRLANACRAPVLAEPTSQFRLGPHDRGAVVTAYERIAARREDILAPDLVIRMGEFPTSKQLRLWLADVDPAQIVIDPEYGWNEPIRTASLIVRSNPAMLLLQIENTAEQRIEGSTGNRFWNAWMAAEREERRGIERSWANQGAPDPARHQGTAQGQRHARHQGTAQGQRHAQHEGNGQGQSDGERLIAGEVHARLAELQGEGGLVYTASSLPIRDQEESLPALENDLYFLANRGANGIDGLIASGLGAARASRRPTTVITGDLAFLHDAGSLALARSLKVPVRIVVLNNEGGGIFERLPQRESMSADEFEALMRTPPGLSIENAAQLYGLPFRRITDLDSLAAAFEGDDDATVIEIPVLG